MRLKLARTACATVPTTLPPLALARASLLFFLFFALHAAPVHAQEARGFEPADLYELRDVTEPAMAPDGRSVAFTVTKSIEAEDARRREVWVQGLHEGRAEGEPFRLSAAHEDSHSPRWSPDGQLLSFRSDRAGDDNPVWFVRMAGPRGEAFHIDGVSGPPIWSPDGRWIAYVDEGASGTVPSSTRSAESAGSGPSVVGRTAAVRATSEGDSSLLPATGAGSWTASRILAVPAEGGAPTLLAVVDGPVLDLTWGEDEEHLYFVRPGGVRSGMSRPGSTGGASSIWRVTWDGNPRPDSAGAGQGIESDEEGGAPDPGDVPGGGAPGRNVVQRPVGALDRLLVGSASIRSPSVSPDGDHIAYRASATPAGPHGLRIAELDRRRDVDGEPVDLTPVFDRNVESFWWGRNAETLFLAARDGAARHLFRVPASGGLVTPITGGARHLRGFTSSRDGGSLAFVASDYGTPPELFVSRGDGSGEMRVTRLNDGWSGGVRLSSAEPLSWTSEDGMRVEGWVLPPVAHGSVDRSTAPVVLVLHDEIHGSWSNRFEPRLQALAGAGYYVFYANPRGSGGYGKTFRTANRERLGMVEKDDLLAGLDVLAERYPDASAERVGVLGHGYGGFLGAWLTATSNRVAAAALSAPTVNWESWSGTSSAARRVEVDLGGALWARRNVYRRLSPLSYVENVTAPTLLLTTKDREHPASEAEQWFAALAERGVPVELVSYPGSRNVGTRQPVDRMTRAEDWLRYWLQDRRADRRPAGR